MGRKTRPAHTPTRAHRLGVVISRPGLDFLLVFFARIVFNERVLCFYVESKIYDDFFFNKLYTIYVGPSGGTNVGEPPTGLLFSRFLGRYMVLVVGGFKSAF